MCAKSSDKYGRTMSVNIGRHRLGYPIFALIAIINIRVIASHISEPTIILMEGYLLSILLAIISIDFDSR
jgi:hypothetical protein